MSTQNTLPPDADWQGENNPARRLIHDLRGPLAVIRGHARLLASGRKGPLNEEQARSLSVIERQVTKLERLLEMVEATDAGRTGNPSFLSGVFSADTLSPVRVLIADDDDDMVALMGELLSGRYELAFAKDGSEALALASAGSFHLAIIDLNLPKLNGFELLQAMRAAGLPRMPATMFLSAESDPQAKVHALALGAADYVTKPFDPEELGARVARIIALVDREASLRADALTDPLTGLANYRNLAESIDREVERSRRYRQPLSLITLDLDHLKAINDEHGHDAGDEAIRLVAQVLKGAVRSFEVVARQGGDEFAVLLPNTGRSEAELLAQRLRSEVAARHVKGVALSASIGVASRDGEQDLDAKALVKASDDALYRAKSAGRDRVETA